MASSRPLSEIEMRLFSQVCEAVHATTESQRDLLRAFVCDELNSEWSRLLTLTASNETLSILSEEELKYLSTLRSAGSSNLSSQTCDEANMFSQTLPMLTSQKTTDSNMVRAAVHDIIQYNDVLEKLLVKYKDYVHRSIFNMRPSSEATDEISMTEQKIAALSLKKDLLKKQIHVLQGKIGNRMERAEGLTRTAPTGVKVADESSSSVSESTALKEVFETTFQSYDHILGKLNALHYEVGHDTFEGDAILHAARRHASQIVLSMATKCRASLDRVFLEASFTYNNSASHVSDYGRAINDERSAVYAEIQSLWDEMVPLAHMVVEKEFLKPITQKVEMRFERQGNRDATVSVYTTAMLRFMNERLRLLADRIQMLVYHHQTLFNAFTHVNSEGKSEPTKGSEIGDTHSIKNTVNDRFKENTLLRTIQRQMELYGSIQIDVEKQPQPTHTSTFRMHVTKLDRYVASRQRKGDDLARSVHGFFETLVKTDLTDAELGSQLLLDSVIAGSAAGSKTGGNVYEDQQVEDSVASLKSQAGQVQTNFGKLREGAGGPSLPHDFVTYAHNKTAKRLSRREGDSWQKPDEQERCPKFTAIVSKWDDPSSFTN
ncbi:hypothetical protein F4677DRAFT_458092 [Hypoxylon crocopeplum]|nr:hypothetical protein F4677DRAFT_458092 [Hypoxylon crocopeplum]